MPYDEITEEMDEEFIQDEYAEFVHCDTGEIMSEEEIDLDLGFICKEFIGDRYYMVYHPYSDGTIEERAIMDRIKELIFNSENVGIEEKVDALIEAVSEIGMLLMEPVMSEPEENEEV